MLTEVAPAVRLFDPATLNEVLASEHASLPRYKQILNDTNKHLVELFDQGTPIEELVQMRVRLIDQLLVHLWQIKLHDPSLALVAVGGYGRGELLPGSDIDLMILHKSRLNPGTQQLIQDYLAFLWDLHLEVGHSVRTIRDCHREAKADITVATNLMESRLLTGDQKLYAEMCKATGPNRIWPTRKFFEAKLAEQVLRHKHHGDTEHNLEPNIKEGPGGLRDIQMIGWVAKRHFGVSDLEALVKHKFLTREEFGTLRSGTLFLWRVRFALHTIVGRREDRLLFDYQKRVAEKFGYKSDDNSGVEQFMKQYYHTVSELNQLNEMLLQLFQEAIIYARRREKIKPLNNRFHIRNDYIEARRSNVFKRYPFALLEIFLLIQQNPSIKGIRASTIRLIRQSLPLIDSAYRKDIRNRSLFMEIIRQPRHVGHELRRMHRYGVLDAYLPAYGAVEGLMQFDLFHVYTVDEHILLVVQYMRFFGMDEYADRFPLPREVLQLIPKQELLYLAGIFHDIAKGRHGDHSLLGKEEAYRFCRNHQLNEFDSRLVAWLVEHHLLMSKTAQREDINDPDVITRFATTVGDIMHLNYLYVLTVADINGTNPQLWNSWKDALLADLYKKTLLALRRGLENPIDKKERLQEVQHQALELIGPKIEEAREIEKIWANLGDDYFIRHSPDEIAWHTRAITKSSEQRLPLVLIREMTQRGGTEIFIYMHDHDNIFSRTVRTLDQLRLNIHDARIITSTNGYTLDTFIVLEGSGRKVTGRDRRKEIKNSLRRNLSNLDKPMKAVSHVRSRKLRHFPVPTRVRFSQDETNNRTLMEVSATDRPGLLSAIGTAMESCGISVQGAKIATYGERAEDIFFITDHRHRMIRNENLFADLRKSISESLPSE